MPAVKNLPQKRKKTQKMETTPDLAHELTWWQTDQKTMYGLKIQSPLQLELLQDKSKDAPPASRDTSVLNTHLRTLE